MASEAPCALITTGPGGASARESAVRTWWRIGWRSLGRNRRRSVITAVGLGVGYFSVVVLVGWWDGVVVEMINNGTGIVTGQLQIHDADYLPDRSVYRTLGGDAGVDVAALLERVTRDPAVSAAAPRVFHGAVPWRGRRPPCAQGSSSAPSSWRSCRSRGRQREAWRFSSR